MTCRTPIAPPASARRAGPSRVLLAVLGLLALALPGVAGAPSASAATTGSIAGTFTGGTSPDGISIWKDGASPGTYVNVAQSVVGPGGGYTIPGLPPGAYYVEFGPGYQLDVIWYPNSGSYAVLRATVVAGETTDVDYTKNATQLITVNVTGPGGAPVEGAAVCLGIGGPDPGPAQPPCDLPGQVTNAAGQMLMGLPPLLYRFSAGKSSAGFNRGVQGEGSPRWIPNGGPNAPVAIHLGHSFTDVGVAHPFFADINWMSWDQLSSGYPDGSFKPSDAVTRQAMASFLYRLAGQPAITHSEPYFADVPLSHPFSSAIQWMADEGLSLGTPNPPGLPLFKPNDAVSRQAMAVFLWRSYGEVPPTLPQPYFADVAQGSTFYPAVQWMAELEISTGTPNPPGKPLYKPTAPVSRQAMSAFLHRYSGLK